MVTVRQLKEEDIRTCADILCSVYNNDLWRCDWQPETAAEYLADCFHMPKFLGYVIEQDGLILGSLFAREKVWWNNSEVYVEELFVRSEHQGKGYGSLLLRHTEEYVRERGLAGITLATNRFAPARSFYLKHGFAESGHVIFMYKEM